MKKIVGLAALLLSLSAGSVFAYTIKILNWSDAQYKVKVTYIGPGVCSNDEWVVPKVKPKGVDAGKLEKGVGICCTKKVVVKRIKDGKTMEFQPPVTGSGVTCRGWTAEIFDTEDGGFNVQRK